nr:MAG TPA: hypothetical protein [Caudoviricetes sp.]
MRKGLLSDQRIERVQQSFGVVGGAAFVLHDVFVGGMAQEHIAAGRTAGVDKLEDAGAVAVAKVLELMFYGFQVSHGNVGFGGQGGQHFGVTGDLDEVLVGIQRQSGADAGNSIGCHGQRLQSKFFYYYSKSAAFSQENSVKSP